MIDVSAKAFLSAVAATAWRKPSGCIRFENRRVGNWLQRVEQTGVLVRVRLVHPSHPPLLCNQESWPRLRSRHCKTIVGPKLTFLSIIIGAATFQYRALADLVERGIQRIAEPQSREFETRAWPGGGLWRAADNGVRRFREQLDTWRSYQKGVQQRMLKDILPSNRRIMANYLAIIGALLVSCTVDLLFFMGFPHWAALGRVDCLVGHYPVPFFKSVNYLFVLVAESGATVIVSLVSQPTNATACPVLSGDDCRHSR